MKSYEFIIKTEKKHIDFINKIIEAHEGYGIVRTLSPSEGIIKIITLKYFVTEIEAILEKLKNHNVPIEVINQGIWEGEL